MGLIGPGAAISHLSQKAAFSMPVGLSSPPALSLSAPQYCTLACRRDLALILGLIGVSEIRDDLVPES